MSNSKQERIDDGNLFISRLSVPGGWVYNSYDKSNQILGSCFVPAVPDTQLRECIDETLEALKSLKNVAQGFLSMADAADHGKTNMNVMNHWILNAENILSKAESLRSKQ